MVYLTEQKYKCLREHLDKAYEILSQLGAEGGIEPPPKPPKITQKMRIEKYRQQLAMPKKNKNL